MENRQNAIGGQNGIGTEISSDVVHREGIEGHLSRRLRSEGIMFTSKAACSLPYMNYDLGNDNGTAYFKLVNNYHRNLSLTH